MTVPYRLIVPTNTFDNWVISYVEYRSQKEENIKTNTLKKDLSFAYDLHFFFLFLRSVFAFERKKRNSSFLARTI